MGRIKCGNMTNLFNADVLLYITRGVDAVLEIDIKKQYTHLDNLVIYIASNVQHKKYND